MGNDLELEQATLHKVGTAPASMVGWTLRDRTGNTRSLDSLGTLAPNQRATIVRHGRAMSMNNSGAEVIELLSPAEAAVDSISCTGRETER